jgi:hypothetical protein
LREMREERDSDSIRTARLRGANRKGSIRRRANAATASCTRPVPGGRSESAVPSKVIFAGMESASGGKISFHGRSGCRTS